MAPMVPLEPARPRHRQDSLTTMSNTRGPVGSGNNPATIASMRAAQPAAGGAPDDDEHRWAQGGRLKALLASIPLVTLATITACTAVFIYELTDDQTQYDNSICWDYGTLRRCDMPPSPGGRGSMLHFQICWSACQDEELMSGAWI